MSPLRCGCSPTAAAGSQAPQAARRLPQQLVANHHVPHSSHQRKQCRHARGSTAAAAAGADVSHNSSSINGAPPAQAAPEHEEQGEQADPTKYPVDIFAALLPYSMGRRAQLALLAAGAAAEVVMLGSLFWAPLLCALAIIATTPSKSEQHRREAALVDRAVARARAELLGRVPITPVENAWWMERTSAALWQPFMEPLLLRQNVTQWQDNLSAAAPKGWDIEIADVSMGTTAPRLTSFQAFGQRPSGALAALDCHMDWDTDSLRMVVRGRGPLGKFVARVSALQLEGDLRLTPVLDQRMLLWAFKAPPAVSVRLAVQGPIGAAAYDVSQFSFIQDLLSSSIQESLVEPRRGALSLDYEMRVEEAIATTINLTVETVRNVPRPAATATTRRPLPRIFVTAYVALSRAKRRTGAHTLMAGSRSVVVRETLQLELTSREGIVLLEARDGSRNGAVIGSARLWVAAARDGSTLLWSSDREGKPLAQRWMVGQRPWRVSLPLEGSPAAAVDVGVSVDPWVYKQAAGASAYRSVGPRAVVVQVVEARQLYRPEAAPMLSPYVVLQYDQAAYTTTPVAGTPSPLWLRTFAFDENASLLTRRVQLEVWSHRRDGWDSSSAAGSSGSNSSSGSSGGRQGRSSALRLERLGNAAINLDLATENVVQDRWLPLNGSEGGEVRVRIAIVPGEHTAPAAQEAAQLLNTTLCRASAPSFTAEVLSARLYLPLSSLDSADGDAGAWTDVRLLHGGVSATGGGRTDTADDEGSGLANRTSVSQGSSMEAAAAGKAGGSAAAPGAATAAVLGAGDRSDCMASAAFMLDAGSPVLRVECRDGAMLTSSVSSLSGDDEDCCAAEVDVLEKLGGTDSWQGWLQLDKDGGRVLLRLTRHEAAEPTDTPIDIPPQEPAALDGDEGSADSTSGSRGEEAVVKLRVAGQGARPEVVALEALLSDVKDVATEQAVKVGSQVKELSQAAASNVSTWFGQLGSRMSSSGSDGAAAEGSDAGSGGMKGLGQVQLLDPARLLPPAGGSTAGSSTAGPDAVQGRHGSKGSGVGGLISNLQHQPLLVNGTANLQKAMQSGWLGGLGKKVAHEAKELLPSSLTSSRSSSRDSRHSSSSSSSSSGDGKSGNGRDSASNDGVADAAVRDAANAMPPAAWQTAAQHSNAKHSTQEASESPSSSTNIGTTAGSRDSHASTKGSSSANSHSSPESTADGMFAIDSTPTTPGQHMPAGHGPSVDHDTEHTGTSSSTGSGNNGSSHMHSGNSAASNADLAVPGPANRHAAAQASGSAGAADGTATAPSGVPVMPDLHGAASKAPAAVERLQSHPLQGIYDDWCDDGAEDDF